MTILAGIKKMLQEASKELHEDGNDSIDLQVDKFLVDYESSATSSIKEESVNHREITENFLSEKEEKPAEKGHEDINLSSFGTDVARLIDNASSLLELRNTILRRATNFLVKNYDDETVRRFKILMEDEFDLSAGESEHDVSDDPQPAAREAGPYGSSGGV